MHWRQSHCLLPQRVAVSSEAAVISYCSPLVTHPALSALEDTDSEGIKTKNGYVRIVQLEELARHDALGDPASHGNRALPVFRNICLHRRCEITAFVTQREQNEVGHTLSRGSDEASSKGLQSATATRT